MEEERTDHVFEHPLLSFTFNSANYSNPIIHCILSLNSFFLEALPNYWW